jgi:tetratricopeptide (TPR) repeat protein
MYFVFLISFGIYIFTLNPALSLRDGAELTTASYSLGIPHPPGYPLFVLLGRSFINIPVGNIAYRVNTMNAAFASAAIVLFYWICLLITNCTISSILAPLFLAFSLNYWVTATGTEVFSLNLTFLALLWILTLLFIKGKSRHSIPLIYLFSFLSGLGLGNHHLLVVGIAVCGTILLVEIYKGKLKINAAKILFFFILGFSVYLFLPIRAKINPFLNYGNPHSLENFISVILRKQYGSLKLSPSETLPYHNLDIKVILWYIRSLISDFTIPLFLCGLFGIISLLKKSKLIAVIFLSQFILYGIGFLLIANMRDSENTRAILERFLHLSYLPFGIFAACGIKGLSVFFKKINPVFIICALLLVTVLLKRLPVANRISTNNYFSLEVAENLTKSFKKNSLVLTQADAPQYATLYYYVVKNKRHDIKVTSSFFHNWRIEQVKKRWPSIIPQGNFYSSREFEEAIIKKNIGAYPIFLAGRTDKSAATEVKDTEIIPMGLTFEVIKKDRNADITGELNKSKAILDYIYFYRNDYLTNLYNKNYFIKEIISKYASQHFNIGQKYLQNKQYDSAVNEFLSANSIITDSPVDSPIIEFNLGVSYSYIDTDRAIKHFQKAIALKPDFSEAYYNLGVLYCNKKQWQKGKGVIQKAIYLNPNYEKAKKKLKELQNLQNN